MDSAHQDALDDATAPDERWDTLAGHLYDPACPEQQLCPDDIVETVARRYAFTSEGRLFYLRKDGEVTERSSNGGRFDLMIDGTRWHPRQAALMRRIFPDAIPSDAEAPSRAEYDPSEERPEWLGNLREKTRPDGARVVHRVSHT
jgi:hypothetical protein